MTDARQAWLWLLRCVQQGNGVESARRAFVRELRRYERIR